MTPNTFKAAILLTAFVGMAGSYAIGRGSPRGERPLEPDSLQKLTLNHSLLRDVGGPIIISNIKWFPAPPEQRGPSWTDPEGRLCVGDEFAANCKPPPAECVSIANADSLLADGFTLLAHCVFGTPDWKFRRAREEVR